MPQTTTKTPMQLRFSVTIEPLTRGFSMSNGLNVGNSFAIMPVTFDQAVEIQRRFHELAETITAEFSLSPEELEKWNQQQEEEQKRLRGIF